QHRGAHRTGEGGVATIVGGRARRVASQLCGSGARRGHAGRVARRAASRVDADRVPAVALPPVERPQGAHARADPRTGLGLQLCRQRERARDLRELPAPQDRRRRPAAHPHRTGRRLHASPSARPDVVRRVNGAAPPRTLAVGQCGVEGPCAGPGGWVLNVCSLDRADQPAWPTRGGDVVATHPNRPLESIVLYNTGGIPVALAFGPDGALYVTDEGRRAILRVAAGEEPADVITHWRGEAINGPNDLAFDQGGNPHLSGPWDSPPHQPHAPAYVHAPRHAHFPP